MQGLEMQTKAEMTNTLPGLESDPNLIDVNRLSEIIGITTARISQLTKEGVFIAVRDGRRNLYDLPFNVQSFIKFKSASKPPLKVVKPDEDFKPGDIYKMRQTEKLELEIEEKKGRLLPADEVNDAWNTRETEIRTVLLNWPYRYGEKRNLCQASIEDMERDLISNLNELADGSPYLQDILPE